jgi:branched-chain amino acid transport system permease protein
MATIGLAFFIEGLSQLLWRGTEVRPLSSGSRRTDPDAAGEVHMVVRSSMSPRTGRRILVDLLAVFLQPHAHRSGAARGGRRSSGRAGGWYSTQTDLGDRVVGRGFVALVAGLMWGARNGVQFALTFVALKALPVLILGGFESIAGAIVGGLISRRIGETGRGLPGQHGRRRHRGLVRLLMALLFLLIRPEGLFGRNTLIACKTLGRRE